MKIIDYCIFKYIHHRVKHGAQRVRVFQPKYSPSILCIFPSREHKRLEVWERGNQNEASAKANGKVRKWISVEKHSTKKNE